MNKNENNQTNAPEEVIELGLASVETKGSGAPLNEVIGRFTGLGISE